MDSATQYLVEKYGSHRGHHEWRAIEEAFNAGMQAALAAAEAQQGAAVEFFAYDSECGFETFKTEAEAKKHAQESIDSYREDATEGWPEEVESVRWGVVLGSTKEVPLTDNDGNDTDWAGDKYVDYVLTERTAQPAQAVPEDWLEAVKEFVERCENGEVRSKHTYAKFKALLAAAPKEPTCKS